MGKKTIIAILIVASLAAYGRILGNDFINFDDVKYITANYHVQRGFNAESIKWAFANSLEYCPLYSPLTWLFIMLNWNMFGADASGHHLVSLLLHIGAVIFLFLFLNKATKSLWPAAFVAALFALHPLRVESVAWAVEIKDVLSMFFGMATLYAYAYYVEKPHFIKYFTCLILFAFSLMSKPMLVTLPCVLLLLDFWPFARWQKPLTPVNIPVADKEHPAARFKRFFPMNANLLWEKVPFFILSIISSILTIWIQNKDGAVASLQKFPFSERILNAIVSYVAYIGKILWPVNMAVFYPYEHSFPLWQVAGSAAVLLAISIAVIWLTRKMPFLAVGWCWYLGTLFPVSGLLQTGMQAMADRYTYLPSIGVGIMLAWGVYYLLPQEKLRKTFLIPFATFVLAALAVLTWQNCGYWENSITLFNHALNVTKNNYLANYNLAMAWADRGEYEEAIKHYREVLKVVPDNEVVHYNLAYFLEKQGKIEEAIYHYREAVRLKPNYLNALNNLGICLRTLQQYDEAISYYRRALAIDPNAAHLRVNLGAALLDKGEAKEAIEHLQAAVLLSPDFEYAQQLLRRAQELTRRQKNNLRKISRQTHEEASTFKQFIRYIPVSAGA